MMGGAASHGRPQVTQEDHVERAGERGTTWTCLAGGKEEEYTEYVAHVRRVFCSTEDWSTAALDPGAWYNNTVQVVCKGGCRVLAAWMR